MLRALFLFLARQENFKSFALQFRIFRDTAARFVAGETLDEAVAAIRQLNSRQITATVDLLGENTRSLDDAESACRDIIGVLDRIERERINSNVSVKLTQLGLALDRASAHRNIRRIIGHARERENFIRVDMEDSPYTQKTLDIVKEVHAELDNVGTVIQACLRRSRQDVADLLQRRIQVRLVKGAYLEPESIAFRRKSDTDRNFVDLMRMLLSSDTHHAIATHDEAIIDETKAFARSRNIPPDHFEFQMLYGIRRDLQLRLAQEGYRVRIYIPYGQRWYPYFMRRLAERPANVWFILKNLFKN